MGPSQQALLRNPGCSKAPNPQSCRSSEATNGLGGAFSPCPPPPALTPLPLPADRRRQRHEARGHRGRPDQDRGGADPDPLAGFGLVPYCLLPLLALRSPAAGVTLAPRGTEVTGGTQLASGFGGGGWVLLRHPRPLLLDSASELERPPGSPRLLRCPRTRFAL